MTRLNGSVWTGSYKSGGTTYTRKFRGFADYETTETPSQFIINVTALGIEKTSGSTTQMVGGQTKTATLEVKIGDTSIGTVGTTTYTDNMPFPSTAPYEIKISDGGQIVINKTASVQTAKLILNASKVDNAWKGSSSIEEEIVVPAYSKPTVSLTIDRNANETTASVTASVSSFVGDTITNFKLTVGGATQTLTGGTIPASGTITRSLTVSGLVLGSITAKLVATGIGGVSQEITRVIPSAFYTMDIGASGKEIAFGSSASGDTVPSNGLFKCEMDVLLKGGKLADYVVDYGTDGIWDWEKWASGKAVAYGKYNITGYSWTGWGSYAIETTNKTAQNLPSGLFIDNPMVFPVIWDEAGSIGLWAETWNYNNGSFLVRGVRPKQSSNPSTAKLTVHVEVRGKWK